jgi:heme o synthase
LQSSRHFGFPTLIRWKVSLAVTFSAFASMVSYTGRITPLQIYPLLGILFLASGASALNQYQEKDTDALMNRTKGRPLPSGRMHPSLSLVISIILVGCGSSLLLTFASVSCFILGLANILWYNGLYTLLKRKTAFAVVPGALTGAIPVYMGWTALGGSFLDPKATLLAFFIFIWQMPHFWLLMLEYHEDYRKAGLASMTDIFSIPQLKSVIMGWMTASTASSFLLIRFGLFHDPVIRIILIILTILVLTFFITRFYFSESRSFRKFFISINIFMMIVLSLVILDVLVSRQG